MTMTLGTLIEVAENMRQNCDHDATVHYKNINPHQKDTDLVGIGDLYSWRGAYQQLCLEAENQDNWLGLEQFICRLRGAIGMTYTGYKGGEFVMNEDTLVWRGFHTHSERFTHGITHFTNDCNIIMIHTKPMDTWKFSEEV